jgi:hypothetical protein
LSPGSTSLYLWNEWDSHPVNIYSVVIKICIVSTCQSCPLCQPCGVGSCLGPTSEVSGIPTP